MFFICIYSVGASESLDKKTLYISEDDTPFEWIDETSDYGGNSPIYIESATVKSMMVGVAWQSISKLATITEENENIDSDVIRVKLPRKSKAKRIIEKPSLDEVMGNNRSDHPAVLCLRKKTY